jgi:hypothetical protein
VVLRPPRLPTCAPARRAARLQERRPHPRPPRNRPAQGVAVGAIREVLIMVREVCIKKEGLDHPISPLLSPWFNLLHGRSSPTEKLPLEGDQPPSPSHTPPDRSTHVGPALLGVGPAAASIAIGSQVDSGGGLLSPECERSIGLGLGSAASHRPRRRTLALRLADSQSSTPYLSPAHCTHRIRRRRRRLGGLLLLRLTTATATAARARGPVC